MKKNILKQLIREVLEEGTVDYHRDAKLYAEKAVKGLVGQTLNLEKLKSLIIGAYITAVDSHSSHINQGLVKEENEPTESDLQKIFMNGFRTGHSSPTDDFTKYNPYPLENKKEYNAFARGFLKGYSS
jgi:hypothetical protein